MSNTPKKPATQNAQDETKTRTRDKYPPNPRALEAKADSEPTPLGNLAGVCEFRESAQLCRIRVTQAP
jgi:hypothetical protein